MARVIEDGEWEIPVMGWRFRKAILDSWCDGKIRELIPNRDFPPAMPLEEIRRRLNRSAVLRDTTINVWPKGNGSIMIQMWPEGSSYRVDTRGVGR